MARSLVRVFALVTLCLLVAPTAFPSLSVEATVTELKKPSRSFADDEIRVEFCTSCGFKQNFMEVKNYLEDKFPHLVDRVHGITYEVDPMKALLARFLGYAQLVAMVLMVFGETIFNALGWDTTLLQKALDNRIGCFAVILLMGSLSQGLVSSGAFEIFYNDDLVFSKLRAGRWPTLDELSAILEDKGLNALY